MAPSIIPALACDERRSGFSHSMRTIGAKKKKVKQKEGKKVCGGKRFHVGVGLRGPPVASERQFSPEG